MQTPSLLPAPLLLCNGVIPSGFEENAQAIQTKYPDDSAFRRAEHPSEIR